jgi:hypothetical protein
LSGDDTEDKGQFWALKEPVMIAQQTESGKKQEEKQTKRFYFL